MKTLRSVVGIVAAISMFMLVSSIVLGQKADPQEFKRKSDTLDKMTSDTFNTKTERKVNYDKGLLKPKEKVKRQYKHVDNQVKDLAEMLVETERFTEFDRDVSADTRALINTVEDSYDLLLISRKIADRELFQMSDWFRDKLLLAIGERMNVQDHKQFSMYEYPSDHKDLVKFTSIRTGNDLFTLAGLYSLVQPPDKFIRDGNRFFQRNDDRDYTGSLLVEVGTDYLNLHGSDPARSYQTFLYGFDVYTPYFRDKTIFSNDTSYNVKDRPHASFQYFGWSRKAISFNKKIRWDVALKVGKIGGGAGAKFQNALHQDISYSDRPRGWGAQVANGGRIGFSIEYKWERQWGDEGRWFIPAFFAEAKLGTFMTTAGVGGQVSNKTFDKSNQNFITLHDRRKSEKLSRVFQKRFMYNVAFGFTGVKHNTMLEGYGILKTNEQKNDALTPRSRYILKKDEVERLVMLLNITTSYSTKYITYFYNWKLISPETTKGDIGIPSKYSVQNGEPRNMDITGRWHHFAEIGLSFNIF